MFTENVTYFNESFEETERVVIEINLKYSIITTIILCIAYMVVCVLGIIGNILVVAVVRRTPRMRNATNVFIANLALADLLVNCLCLPFTLLSNILNVWILGAVICKTVPYLQGVSVSASVHTLVAIAIERCVAICCPMRAPVMSNKSCYIIIIIIWIFSLTITLPWALFFQLQPLELGSSLQICVEVWPSPYNGDIYFIVAHLILCYLAPLIIITFCYLLVWGIVKRKVPGEPTQGAQVLNMMNKTRAKVIQMLVIVVASFAFSWFPLYALFVWVKLGPERHTKFEESFIDVMVPIAQWLGASNSCINPVLYAFFNRRFRAGFRLVLSCCFQRKPKGLTKKQLKLNQPSSLLLQRRGCIYRKPLTYRQPQQNRPRKINNEIRVMVTPI